MTDGTGALTGQWLSEGTRRVLADVARERQAQDAMWGLQDFPDGTGLPGSEEEADAAKALVEANWKSGALTWWQVLHEEVREAAAESEPAKLRTELVQSAAVAVKWVEALDRRNGMLEHRTKQGGGRAEWLIRDGDASDIDPGRLRVAEPGEFRSLLMVKAYAALGDYISDPCQANVVELAEVVCALAAGDGLSPQDLEAHRAREAEARGGFHGRLVVSDSARPEPSEGAAPVSER
ncbi:nucleoside triphosphate pyrophosphohydrolase family protein [Actinomadura harenae]|uniref:hypothetical protein n=1 Tax=Actinomadura harenae TaxID=2483351 RepID=UPI0018F62501|nr:hypothetical protein [Actinomadura harenae]